MCQCIPDLIESVGCDGEGKTGVPRENPFGARERTNNKLNPHMVSMPGFKPGPHWWEASALTTMPPLLISIAAETKSTASQASVSKHILVFSFPTKITSVKKVQQRFVSCFFVLCNSCVGSSLISNLASHCVH